jgi:poly(3-hydroxybutyrate) depolymerase
LFQYHIVKDIAGNNQFVVAYDTNIGSLQNIITAAAARDDIQRLANDVAQLRAVVNTLIQQLKA